MRLYFRILEYGKPYAWLGVWALIFLIIYNIFSAVSLVSVIPFLEILFADSYISEPTSALDLFDMESVKEYAYVALKDNIIALGKWKVLLYFCVALVISIFIKNASRFMASYFIAPLESGIIERIRAHLFQHLGTLGLPFYTQRKKGNVIGIMVSDVEVVQASIIGTLQAVIRDPITMITFFLVMLMISWKLTLFTLIILPITGLFIAFIAKSLKRKSMQGQERLGELIGILDEFISGIRIVKAFQKEAYESSKYKEKNQAYRDLQVGIKRRMDSASPLTEILSIIVVCIIILYGGSLILKENPELKASEFIGFIAVFSQFLAPVKTFSTAISKIQKGMAAFERIQALLDEEAAIREEENAEVLPSFEKELTFDDVSFRYEAERDVLKKISFSVQKGQTLALVGPSGGGKSTLADLIPRFYDPYNGKICIDGKDIKSLSIASLRAQIGYVTQEGILFHDTVGKNIAYGLPDLQESQIIEAAKVANAHDFIKDLPEGYHTLIGERGTKLSGGQRQRIAIARAVLRNPSILILDEATSNLDTESEKLVQDAIDKLTANRTSIVIAHRLSTILKADQILVVQEGKIVESGNHESLSKANGMYQKLYEIQFG